jgi:hypothetical protein
MQLSRGSIEEQTKKCVENGIVPIVVSRISNVYFLKKRHKFDFKNADII